MCFLMYSYELHSFTLKKFQKNVAFEFYCAFRGENWAKIRENLSFLLKSRYLRIIQKNRSQDWEMLETWNLTKL